MKKLILAVALLSVSQFAAANNLCEIESIFIKEISKSHQAGVELQKVLDVFKARKAAGDSSLSNAAIDIFSGPRYSVAVNQRRATTDVVNDYLIKCLNKAK